MKELKQAARKLLFELGAPAGSKGFDYMVEILCDGIVNDKKIVSGCGLYAKWALVFEDTPTRTERTLRHVKNVCLIKNNSNFQSIFGNVSIDEKLGLYSFMEMLRLHLLDQVECNR